MNIMTRIMMITKVQDDLLLNPTARIKHMGNTIFCIFTKIIIDWFTGVTMLGIRSIRHTAEQVIFLNPTKPFCI